MGIAGRPRKTAGEKFKAGTRYAKQKKFSISGEALITVPEITFEDPTAQDYYDRVCSILIQNGWLLDDFMNDIIRAADWYSMYMDAKDRPMIMRTHTGYECVSPAYSLMKEAHKNLVDFENRYGLNLLSSQRFERKRPESDPFEKLMKL